MREVLLEIKEVSKHFGGGGENADRVGAGVFAA